MSIRKQLENVPRGIKASAALFFATVVTKGIAYLTTPIFTRLLTAEEYGQVSVFQTWMGFWGIVAMFSLSAGVFNNGMSDYPDDRDEYSFSMLMLSNLITVASFGLLLCLFPRLRRWIGLDWPLMLLMGAVFLFQPAYNFWVSRQRYELKYKATALWAVGCALISPLTALLFVLLTDVNRTYARIFGAELPLIAVYIGFYIYLGLKVKGRVRVDYWRSAFFFNLPLIPHYLSGSLLGGSDKLMIAKLVGDAATAHYSVAYSVASIANIVWSSVNASLIPYTYERCKENDHKAVSDVTMPILTGVAVLCAAVIMLGPEVVAVMATKEYMEAVYAIPPVVAGVFFQVQYFIYANVIYYYKRPRYVMYASVSSAVLNIALNYVFIPRCGYIAAGYTTLVCYLLQAAADYWAMKKVVQSPVYDMKHVGLLSLILVGVALACNWIYRYPVIRYALCLAVLIFAALFFTRYAGSLKKNKRP